MRFASRFPVLLLLALHAAAAAGASITPIGTGPAVGPRAGTSATDLSGDGRTVIGVLDHGDRLCERGPNTLSGYVWTASQGMTLLPAPSGFRAEPVSISRDGAVVVGNLVGHETLPDEAFRWTQAGGLESFRGGATAVSADGAYVLGSIDPASPYYYDIPFVGDPHGPAPLPIDQRLLGSITYSASDDLSVFTGSGDFSRHDGPNVYRLEPSTNDSPRPVLPSGYEDWISYGTRVSADGSTIVGPIASPPTDRDNPRIEAFVWQDGQPVLPIGYVGSDLSNYPESWARDVSGDGSVVVGYSWTRDDSSAFVWTEETGMQSLEVLLAQAGVDLGDWHLHDVAGISDDGRTLVTTGSDGVASRSFLVVIPEPRTVILLGLGLAALAYRERHSAGPSTGIR